MKKSTLPIYTGTTSYCESLAYSLIAYANVTPTFADKLRCIIPNYVESVDIHHTVSIPHLTPIDDTQAERRALWLVNLHTHNIQEAEKAVQILSSWLYEKVYESPKSPALGLKYGILNYGIWGHPKRPHEPLNILVRDSIVENTSKKEFSKISVSLTSRVLESGLIRANGNTKLLEPELADWLFGGKNIVIHSGTKSALVSIENELEEIHALYVKETDDNGPTFVALSPTIYLQDIVASHSLELLS